jgi:hypothetical protein
MGHNSTHGEEAERVQLISFVSQLISADAEVETAKGPYDAAKAKRRGIMKLAGAAGFPAEALKERMEEMNRPASENEQRFAAAARHRLWLGVTSPEQTKMHLEGGTPQEAVDEHDWQARGYRDGLRGLGAKLPEGIPARMDQPYLRGHEIGRKEHLDALEANVPGGKRLREQAAQDFAEDNPGAGTPEAKAAERKSVERAKASLEKMNGADPEEAVV